MSQGTDCAHPEVNWMRTLWVLVITGAICRDCGVSWPLLGMPPDIIENLPEGPRRDALREAAKSVRDDG